MDTGMEYVLSPSILAADVTKLGEEIKAVCGAGAKYVHIDVMDGTFVPNISFGIPIVKGLRNEVDNFFDVHLMVQEPHHLIKKFAEAGSDGITIHLEACEDVEKTLELIAECGVKAGIAISPDTPVEKLKPYLSKVYMILIMTVYPGYGGQKMIETTIPKIRELRNMIEELDHHVDIEVDGGINADNVHILLEAGANVIVAGTKVFRGNIMENVKVFHEIFEHYL